MDWKNFSACMVDQFPCLNIMNVNYRIPDLEGFHSTNAFIGEGTVEITCADPSADIDYTTDGSVSTLESSQYTVSLLRRQQTLHSVPSARTGRKVIS